MQLDSATLLLLQKEMETALISTQVRQIRQVDRRIFDIELFRKSAPHTHLICDTYHPIVYLTQQNRKEKGYIPSQNFCMTLRKHLENARLSAIKQIEMDRILRFSFDRIENGSAIITKHLYAELIPSAPNLILVENDTILDACLRGKRQDRFLFPQEPYRLPLNTSRMNFLQFTEEEIENILRFAEDKSIPLSKWLFENFNGFSSTSVMHIAETTHIAPNTPVATLTQKEKKRLTKAITDYGQALKTSQGIYLYKKENNKTLISTIPLPLYASPSSPAEPIPLLPYLEKEMEHSGNTIIPGMNEFRKHIQSTLKKEKRKAGKIKEEMEETESMDTYKLYGQLLAIYAYEHTNHRSEITVLNLFREPAVDITIPIDPLRSLTDNSQSYFKKYQKMKTRISLARAKMEEIQNHITYLENLLYFIDTIKNKNELTALQNEWQSLNWSRKKQSSKAKPNNKAKDHIPTISIDGITVRYGRNNRENEELTLHKAKKNDLWLHAKNLPGSHVIIDIDHDPISEDSLRKIASFTAAHSTGKNSSKVDVDITEVRHVKKIPKSAPGMVYYTHQKTYTVDPHTPEE